MLNQLTRNWWVVGLRGAFAVLWGILAIAWPGITLAMLVLLFGAFALIDGCVAVFSGITHGETLNRGWIIAQGLAGVGVGVFTLLYPGVSMLVLVFLVAGWALVSGALQVITALELRKELRGEWFLVLSGVLSVVLGICIAAFPIAGAVTIVYIIGGYAIVFGLLLVALAFQLRSREAKPHIGKAQMA